MGIFPVFFFLLYQSKNKRGGGGGREQDALTATPFIPAGDINHLLCLTATLPIKHLQQLTPKLVFLEFPQMQSQLS